MKHSVLILMSVLICLPNQSQAQLFKKKKKKTKTEQADNIAKKNKSNYVYFDGFRGYETEYSDPSTVDYDTVSETDLTILSTPDFEENSQDFDFGDIATISNRSLESNLEASSAVDYDNLDVIEFEDEPSLEFEENSQDFDIEDVITISDKSLEVQPEGGSAFKRFSKAIQSKLFAPSSKTDGMSIAALCCGVFGLLIFGFGILGITFGAIGIKNTSENGTRGKGMAIAGLVCGIVKLAIVMAVLLAI